MKYKHFKQALLFKVGSVIKVLDWFKVTTYGAAASDGGCSFFFVLKMP